MKRTVKVILIPQKQYKYPKKNDVVLFNNKLSLIEKDTDLDSDHPVAYASAIPQHLYIVDENTTIKEGDWYIMENKLYLSGTGEKGIGCAKVVAATDLSSVPSISEDFLKEFVAANGKGEIMMDIERYIQESKKGGGYLHKQTFDNNEVKTIYSNGPKNYQEAYKQGYSEVHLPKLDQSGNAILSIVSEQYTNKGFDDDSTVR